MPTVAELKEHLKRFNKYDYIAYDIWNIEDVYQCAETCDLPEPDSEIAGRILADMHRHRNCEIGLNWDNLEYHMYEHWDADAGQWKE
jgi:hypothetical protein